MCRSTLDASKRHLLTSLAPVNPRKVRGPWLHKLAILRHSRPFSRECESFNVQIRLHFWECRPFFLAHDHHQAQVGVLNACDVMPSVHAAVPSMT